MRNISYSLLFADDLALINCFDRPGKILSLIKRYLAILETWMKSWKLRVSGSKCQYIIIGKGDKPNLEFKIFNEKIPYEKHPVFLGVTFDESLAFQEHIKKLRQRCTKRLNIIKIISHKSWKLKRETVVATYFSLVRSLIDYSAFAAERFSSTNMTYLQVIQNQMIRATFRPPFLTNLTNFANSMHIPTLEARLASIFTKYVLTGWQNSNPLTNQLTKEYLRGFEGRPLKLRTPLCQFREVIQINRQYFND